MPKPRSNKTRTAQKNTEHEIQTQGISLNTTESPRVVIDTCVFISAKISTNNTSSPFKIIEKWREGYFILIISPKLLEELILKLSERTECTERYINNFVEEILLNSLMLDDDWETNCFDSIDPEDNILASAIYQGNAHYLVSTDKAVLNKKTFQNTTIINPNNFLVELNKKNIQIQKLDLISINKTIKFKVEVEV